MVSGMKSSPFNPEAIHAPVAIVGIVILFEI
jgi:hypothetical protein